MIWADFERAAPALAAIGRERLDAPGLLLLVTLRRDGHPRVSPVEPIFCDGELQLGMMWRSRKALDLQRDPRCTVHSIVTRREGDEGDFKLYGRAREVLELEARERYCDALFTRIGWKPDEPEFHLFAIEVLRVGYTRFDKGKLERRSWPS